MPRILITAGDPAGIGPEVIGKALSSGKLPAGFDFEILGDTTAGTPGKPDRRSAEAALAGLQEAAARLKDGTGDAVVTAPVSKEALQSVGFTFPGQTEFFADAFGVEDFGMLLTGERLTVGLATIHEPLKSIPTLLTPEKIIRISRLTAAFLSRRGITRPRIALAGLNPHAGENGAFGDEERTIISPALGILRADGDAEYTGPAVPDAIFREATLGSQDAVIAMYHDQGLIPLKLLDFDTAVNVTLGLPKPRTSPDHGTAYGIAGKNIADPSSMIAAIRLACELAR
ncbi:4-hydroxythreonine-4-phosphate dehydrogenase PdxA [Luteolibacter sp. SL250]|uniref:4-hydroxythreonine-4-phosphate dehydrogenase PdxA n=1 Tax=Luteolibacter sp. SL250 TaxID=2995170 RepID=UPI002271210B|nr:4-hydroxythreonine-4-phosphate dehydrogenase PdxA [Luteolibacter sp. SL250]WAC19204.1 4-hydroxythreonine-4-phosphate dehydrogenase PdxA [Luteolibacter sp. SL250]